MKTILFYIPLVCMMFSSVDLSADRFTINGKIISSTADANFKEVDIYIINQLSDIILILHPDERGCFTAEYDLPEGLETVFVIEVADPCSGVEHRREFINEGDHKDVEFIFCSDATNCQVDFKYEFLSNDALKVRFNEKTNFEYQKIIWSFGDGSISDDRNPMHQYEKAGTYEVVLEIGGEDCSARIAKQIRVGHFTCNCPEYFQPVCAIGPNGEYKKFDNPCFALCEGFDLLVSCDSCNCSDTIDPVCIAVFGGIVQFQNACEAKCAGFDYFQCDSINCDCPDVYEPVCIIRDDGTTLTFHNECYAHCQGYDDFVLCDTGCICPEIYDPVCVFTASGDTLTFSNECEARCNGFTDYFKCNPDCVCPDINDPVCVIQDNGNIIRFANQCIAKCEGFENFVNCTDTCECFTDEVDPVCVYTSDSILLTFQNKCWAKCAGYNEFFKCDTLVCDCDDVFEPVCVATPSAGQLLRFANACEAECAGYFNYYSCADTCLCPAIYDPVCVYSDDGSIKEFSNSCEARCAGFSDWFSCEDSCVCSREYEPVCVVNDEGEIVTFNNECLAKCAGYTEFVNCFSPCNCPDTYEPVCLKVIPGIRLVFDNECIAECFGFTGFEKCFRETDDPGVPHELSSDRNESLAESMKLYPNPSLGFSKLVIEEEVVQPEYIDVINKLGQVVKTIPVGKDEREINIDLQDIPNGIYFIRVTGKGKNLSLPLIKN